MLNLEKILLEYHQKELVKEKLKTSPTEQVKDWLKEAVDKGISYPNAMTLSTVTKDGYPSSRIVLAKEINTKGIVFYTNYNSAKGQDILNSNKVSLSFFWKEFDRQIRINGVAHKISYADSNKYFQSRPRLSQVSALASPQSEVITKQQLNKNFLDLEDQSQLECPKNWGGFCVSIEYLEVWQGRPNRLHDRFCYQKNKDKWNISRLAP